MDEVWEVNGETYNVGPNQRDRFLNDYPNAVLVRSADQDSSFVSPGSMTPGGQIASNQQGFQQQGFQQQGFGGVITPGGVTTQQPEKSDLEEWWDNSWFGSKINESKATGETAAVINEMSLPGSVLTMETISDMVDANIEVAQNYVESERMNNFQKTYQKEGKTWTAFARGVWENPLILPELFVNSLGTQVGTLIDSPQAQVAAGSGFTAGFASGGANPYQRVGRGVYTGMAALSMSMESSLTFAELVKEELKKENANWTDDNWLEWYTDENVYNLLNGPKGKSIRNKAVGRGFTIGAIEGITGWGAGRATSAVLSRGPGMGRKFAAATTGVVVEGVGGGLGEAAGMTVAGQELDIAEIGFEAVTGTTTAPLNVGLAMMGHKPATYKLNKQEVSFATMKDFVNTATDMEIATANIQMINDQTGLKMKAWEKQTNAQYDSRIDTKITDTKDRTKLVELQKELAVAERENKAKDTPSEVPGAEENLTRIQTEIKSIINKYSGAVDLGKTKLSQKVEAKVAENRLDQTIDFLETNKEFVGKDVVIADNTAATKKAYRKAAIEYNKKNPDGKQYNVNDDMSNGDGFIVGDVIVVNKEVARKTGAYSVGSHELLHGILAKHMKSLDATGKAKLGKSFMNVLTSKQRNAVTTRLEKQYGLTGDGIYSEVGVQEMFTVFSDAIAKNEITFDEGVFDKLKNVIQEILRVATGGLLVKEFSNGRQAYNFLKDYQNTISEGGEISSRAKKLAGGGVSVGPVGDRSGGLKSQTGDTAPIKRSKAVKVVNDIENVLKEKLKEKGKEYTQDEFRTSTEFRQIFDSIYEENGAINNYLKSLGLSKEKFDATVKSASMRLMGYDPQAKRKTGSKEEITVGERIMSDISFAKLDAAKKLGKESEVENVTKRIDDTKKTKEGDRTFDIEDTSTDASMKALEEEDMSAAGQAKKKADAIKAKEKKYSKFRRKLGIEKGSELYNKILDAARQSLLKAYEIGTPVRNIQRKLRDQANRYLFKDIKNFLGTDKYINNLKEYRTYIVDAIFTSDLVQLEKMLPEDQRVFTVFERELGTKAEVEAAVENNLLPKEALNVIDKGNTVRLYKKVKQVDFTENKKIAQKQENDFIKFFNQPAINPETGKRSGLKGTRKDSLARAMAGALSYDATLEVAQTPEIMEMRQDYAELKGESLVKDDIDQLASAIGRDKGVLFSSSPDIAAQMAVEINKNVNDILSGKDVLETIEKGKGKIIYDLKDKNLKKANGKSFAKKDRQTIASISKNIAENNTYGEITNDKALKLALREVVKAKKKGKSIKLGDAFEQLMINQVKAAIKQIFGKKSLLQSTKSYKGKKKGDLYLSYLLSRLGIEVKMDKARGASKTARYKDGGFSFTQNNETINESTGKKFDDEIMEIIQDQITEINKLFDENGLDPIGDDYKLNPRQIGLLSRNKHKFGIKGIFLSEEYLGHAYSHETYAKDPQGMIQIGGKLYRMKTGIDAVDGLTSVIAAELGIPTLEFTKDGTMEMVGSIDVSSGSLKFRIYPLINEKNFVDSKANLLNEGFSKKFVKASEKIMKIPAKETMSTLRSVSPDAPSKGITILDFDDTLATTKSKIRFTRPDGTKGKLNAEEYASTYEDLLGLGYEFDFSEFSKVVDGKTAPLFNKALKLQKKFGNKQMYVLTARPADAAPAIHAFLTANGLNIPLANITGLANSTSEAKALWVAEKVGEGFNDFYFADDAIQNVKAVQNVLNQFDVKSKVQQAKVLFSKSDIKTLKESKVYKKFSNGLKGKKLYHGGNKIVDKIPGVKNEEYLTWFWNNDQQGAEMHIDAMSENPIYANLPIYEVDFNSINESHVIFPDFEYIPYMVIKEAVDKVYPEGRIPTKTRKKYADKREQKLRDKRLEGSRTSDYGATSIMSDPKAMEILEYFLEWSFKNPELFEDYTGTPFYENGEISTGLPMIVLGAIPSNKRSIVNPKDYKMTPTVRFSKSSLRNNKAVNNLLSQIDVKSKVQRAKVLFSKSMDKEFNVILSQVTDIDAKTKISKKKAERLGARKGMFRLFIPPSHEDFLGLLYNFMGKGEQGNKHRAFFEKALLRPLNRAYRALNTMQQSIARDFKELNKQFGEVKSKLKNEIPGLGFTYEDAVRVYLWNKYKHKIPGLDKSEIKELVNIVKKDSELRAYAENIRSISKQKKYVAPSESWSAGDIRTDLGDAADVVGRVELFKEFQKNADIIFSEKNLNKIEAAFGKDVREALEDNLYRTRTGRNRPSGQNALVNRFMNYINGSVGATMFVNIRSAVLQQMSMVNYINFGDNNIFKAAARFADQKQFWTDWAMIFNSDMIKQRRGGIKTDVNGAELAASLKGSRNTPRALIAKLLELGFLPTQIGDNIAIATGGASFYRNRVNTYLKQGLSQKQAETKAWTDFQAVTESTQQSARPDMVSQQQASPLGKIILAFQNVTSQFNRLAKKSFLDLKNRRISPGSTNQVQSDISNASRIVYYLAIQNVIFYSLQTALFAAMFDDNEDDEKMLKKKERVINGTLDSILRGTGIFGTIVSTVKNATIKYLEQREVKYNPDESAVVGEVMNVSPPVGIKHRKITNAEKTLNYNKDVIEEMETLDFDNPIWSARTSQIEAITNVPVNRLYNKVRNVRDALNSDYENYQRVLLLLGWSRYNLGIEDTKIKEVKKEVKEKKKQEKKKDSKNKTTKKKTFKKKVFRKRGF
jgi:hypothetical protein